MLSSVLGSKQAIAANKELSRRLDRMEKDYDTKFKMVFDAIRKLMEPPPVPPKRQIGYIYHEEKD